ncbi:hypothetical protein ACFLYK_01210 [Candidatus Cloacimonadota bacterium]
MNRFKLILIVVFVALISILNAHPASDVEMTFDKETSILTVNYIHKVSDAEKHFIFETTVYLNKEEIITQAIQMQDTLEGGQLVYKIIDAKPGDKILVKTNCNKSGKKSGELVIE